MQDSSSFIRFLVPQKKEGGPPGHHIELTTCLLMCVCDIFLGSPTAGSIPWSPHGAVRTECAVDMHARQCARQMHVNHQFFTQNTCRSRVHVKLCRPVDKMAVAFVCFT